MGDLSTRDGKAATDFIRGTKETRGMFVWNDRYLDIPIEKLKAEIMSPKYNGIVFIEHSWTQLKRSMAWYEKQCSLVAYNQEVILREIQLQRLAGSNLSPFTREQQLYLSSHKRKPVEEIDVKTKDTISTVALYEKFDRRIPYVIGIDPSEGLSGDNNAMIIVNPFTYKVAAEYKCPYISPKDFSKFIVNFMDRYCPTALLVVEANRGRELLQRLSDSHYRSRIWYDKDRMNQLMAVKTDEYGGIPNSTLMRKVQGFVTGTKSRSLLFSCLEQMVMENIDCIFSENLVNEILTLIRKPTGKIEAAPGEHDDCVMAYLIGLYVYLNASNLSEYGMSRRMRAPGQVVEREVETEQEYRSRVRGSLDSIPERYRDIFQEFINQKDPVTDARRYARELAAAQEAEKAEMERLNPGLYDDYGDETISFDQQMGSSRRQPPQKLGMQFHQIGEQYRTYNGQRDRDFNILDSEPDIFTEGDRESFEKGIFDSNFRGRNTYDPFDSLSADNGLDEFDPDDWV